MVEAVAGGGEITRAITALDEELVGGVRYQARQDHGMPQAEGVVERRLEAEVRRWTILDLGGGRFTRAPADCGAIARPAYRQNLADHRGYAIGGSQHPDPDVEVVLAGVRLEHGGVAAQRGELHRVADPVLRIRIRDPQPQLVGARA